MASPQMAAAGSDPVRTSHLQAHMGLYVKREMASCGSQVSECYGRAAL
jgi:hypothetical protein